MAGPPRSDLRQYDELRPFMVEFDIASEATSSVIVSQGNTKVSVSVYGPSQPRYLRHEEYDKCTIDVEYRANYNGSTSNRSVIENEGIVMVSRMLESALLLEQFPRMMILIKVNVLQDDGSLSAVVLNACALALCKSGIPMSYVPVSVGCVQIKSDHILLDPALSEETSAHTISTHNFTFKSPPGDDSCCVLSSTSDGCFSVEVMKNALDVCSAAAVNVDKAMRSYIMESMS